jgi:hypothetical protein
VGDSPVMRLAEVLALLGIDPDIPTMRTTVT